MRLQARLTAIFVSMLAFWAGSQDARPSCVPSMLRTERPGWKTLPSDAKEDFLQIQFVNREEAWAITRDQIWRTDNGGAHWLPIRTATWYPTQLGTKSQAAMVKIQFFNRSEGWLLEGDTLLYTGDSGVSWKAFKWDHYAPRSFYFTDRSHGWVVGQILSANDADTEEPSRGGVYCTQDSGHSWEEMSIGIHVNYDWSLSDICLASSKEIWVVGTLSFKSDDGGLTWSRVTFPSDDIIHGTPSAISFSNSQLGWVRTNQPGGHLATFDGGRNWRAVAPPPGMDFLDDMVYLNNKEVWGISGGVYCSEDGGMSWLRVADGEFHVLQYLRVGRLLFAGGKGILGVCELR